MKHLRIIALVALMAVLALGAAAQASGLDVSFEGRNFTFETADLDGASVTSGELFGGSRITMVNIWASWCGPCVSELSELAEIHAQLQPEGAGVVGILLDADTDAGVRDAKALMAEHGTNYPVVAFDGAMQEILPELQYIPTTFFVDSTGRIVGETFVGAMPEAYLPAAMSLLAGMGEPAQAADGYRVIVTDPEGNPVAGAMVQFCSDATCTMAQTDADGIARFDAPEAAGYTVHVLKAPEGFEGDDREYAVPEQYADVAVTLRRAG